MAQTAADVLIDTLFRQGARTHLRRVKVQAEVKVGTNLRKAEVEA